MRYFINGTNEDSIVLTKKEAASLVKELESAFITRENELCIEVVMALMKFVEESNNAAWNREINKA